MPADNLAVTFELRQQGVGVRAVHGVGNQCQIIGRIRQFVRLRIVKVLQAVFQAAQEGVGRCQFGHGPLRQNAASSQLLQYVQGRTDLQAAVPPAADELEYLGDELDLANAARADLDVVGAVAATDFATDLRVQVAHGVEGAVIEILAKHEGTRDLLQLGEAFAVERPRLDPGVAFPLTPLGDEVVLQRVEGAYQRPGVPVRTQAHVDAEYLAVFGDVGQRPDDALAQPLEELEIADHPRAAGVAVFGIDEDQVDVR